MIMILKSIKPTQDSSEHSEEYTKDCIKSDDWIEAGGIGNAVSCVAERNMGSSYTRPQFNLPGGRCNGCHERSFQITCRVDPIGHN